MERKEPTLSGSANNAGAASNEREESTFRRQAPVYDEPRTSRSSGNYAAVPAPSSLPLIALLVAIVGVLGGGFLGFELMDANGKIAKDAARIQQLENQLNVASSESTQSVTALGINLQKVDGDVKKLQDTVRKLNSDHNEKLASLSKSLDNAKAEINNVKGDANSLKQDSLAHKASLEEMTPRIDNLEKNIADQRKKIVDATASINAILNQVKSAEGLASRITKTEEAIDAIDDNRRTINKDLVQIKQQLGIKN
jgi:chromosome segregation ATPase